MFDFLGARLRLDPNHPTKKIRVLWKAVTTESGNDTAPT